MLALMTIAGGLAAAPASACRSPAKKDRDGYRRVIEALLAAWWHRDYRTFSAFFNHPEVSPPAGARKLFDAHFDLQAPRQVGEILFNGASAIVQIVMPRGADAEHGICGGHAWADLILVKFYPGLEELVVEDIRYVDGDVLAPEEWRPARA